MKKTMKIIEITFLFLIGVAIIYETSQIINAHLEKSEAAQQKRKASLSGDPIPGGRLDLPSIPAESQDAMKEFILKNKATKSN